MVWLFKFTSPGIKAKKVLYVTAQKSYTSCSFPSSISAVSSRPPALRWLLSLLLGAAEEQLSVTAQGTPTPLWAVVWGPTQPLEDETYHFMSSQETEPLSYPGRQQAGGSTTPQDWPHGSAGSANPPGDTLLLPKPKEGAEDQGTEAEETEPEEVDPQFYVTVTISSLLILTAVVITAKLCLSLSLSYSAAVSVEPLISGLLQRCQSDCRSSTDNPAVCLSLIHDKLSLSLSLPLLFH
ncbi:hypothetical protein WMY93_026658 [Mugilogobius chulae]|uniref:Uncharacterized protein n=1 Tax=Mugilogobius chulae TaxID=88201 RepID=A0AAW0NAU1_9GOBI